MTKDDSPAFERLIEDLFESYERRKPSGAGVLRWFRSLQGFAYPMVERAVDVWISTKNKMPAISELVGACTGQVAIDRAQRAQREDGTYRKWLKTAPTAATAAGREAIAKLQTFLRDHPKEAPSRAWAQRVLDAQKEGTGLFHVDAATGLQLPIGPQPVSDLQVNMAREALYGRRLPTAEPRRRERVPGEDDE